LVVVKNNPPFSNDPRFSIVGRGGAIGRNPPQVTTVFFHQGRLNHETFVHLRGRCRAFDGRWLRHHFGHLALRGFYAERLGFSEGFEIGWLDRESR
jgi:hypothetical protein